MYKNILIPTDGSELSRKAVEHGVLLARALKARVTSITVIRYPKSSTLNQLVLRNCRKNGDIRT